MERLAHSTDLYAIRAVKEYLWSRTIERALAHRQASAGLVNQW